MGDVSQLPPEIQEKVYRPGADESYNVNVDLLSAEVFGPEEEKSE